MTTQCSDSICELQAIRYMVEIAGRSDLLDAVGMHTNEEVRRHRLEQLCTLHGTQAVALKAGLSWQALDQVVKGVLLPAKEDGTRSPRALGAPAARAIESAYELGEGWMDWPFDFVDFKSWVALTPKQQIYAQAGIEKAIQDAAEKAVLAYQDRDD